MNNIKIAILSTYTADLLAESIVAQLANRNFTGKAYVSPYGQYQQVVLKQNSEFHEFEPDVTLLVLDGEDLFADVWGAPLDFSAETCQDRVREELANLTLLIETLVAQQPKCSVLVTSIFVPPLNALGLLEGRIQGSLKPLARLYNEGLQLLSRRFSQVVIVDVENVMTRIGYETWADDRLWYLAKMRLSSKGTDALAQFCAVHIAALKQGSRKCLVLDLDNTLWGGIVGEDGLAGLRLGRDGIGAAFRDFQKDIHTLKQRGIVLAVSSKNNQSDVEEVFRAHPDMVLRWEDFAAVRIDWRDKPIHLRELSEELSLGLDSFVFIDDNPVERAFMRSEMPEVFVVDMPSDPSGYRRTLRELDCFASLALTDEDRARSADYRAQVQRGQCLAQAASMEVFYRSLDLSVRIKPVTAFEIPRVAQLTQRTNQFNLTTRRYTESEIRRMNEDAHHVIYSLQSKDKFGDNGLVGVAIIVKEEAVWRLDTFLMSCRVLGRTLETAFIAVLVSEARRSGIINFMAEYIPTAKNTPAARFLENHGFHKAVDVDGSWVLSVSDVQLHVPEWVKQY